MEIQTLLEQPNFSFQSYMNPIICTIDFYVVLSERVCSRSSSPNSLNVKRPSVQFSLGLGNRLWAEIDIKALASQCCANSKVNIITKDVIIQQKKDQQHMSCH